MQASGVATAAAAAAMVFIYLPLGREGSPLFWCASSILVVVVGRRKQHESESLHMAMYSFAICLYPPTSGELSFACSNLLEASGWDSPSSRGQSWLWLENRDGNGKGWGQFGHLMIRLADELLVVVGAVP